MNTKKINRSVDRGVIVHKIHNVVCAYLWEDVSVTFSTAGETKETQRVTFFFSFILKMKILNGSSLAIVFNVKM